ncbi:hypothetical protein V8F33_014042 [Rhypophila sp. PSN 637]
MVTQPKIALVVRSGVWEYMQLPFWYAVQAEESDNPVNSSILDELDKAVTYHWRAASRWQSALGIIDTKDLSGPSLPVASDGPGSSVHLSGDDDHGERSLGVQPEDSWLTPAAANTLRREGLMGLKKALSSLLLQLNGGLSYPGIDPRILMDGSDNDSYRYIRKGLLLGKHILA